MKFDKIAWAEIVKEAIGTHTQNEFSRLCGVNKASISNFVTGSKNQPTYDTILKISKAAPHVSLNRLLKAGGYAVVESDIDTAKLTQEILSLLIDTGIVNPQKEMTDKERNEIVNFVRKCLDLKTTMIDIENNIK